MDWVQAGAADGIAFGSSPRRLRTSRRSPIRPAGMAWLNRRSWFIRDCDEVEVEPQSPTGHAFDLGDPEVIAVAAVHPPPGRSAPWVVGRLSAPAREALMADPEGHVPTEHLSEVLQSGHVSGGAEWRGTAGPLPPLFLPPETRLFIAQQAAAQTDAPPSEG